MAARTFKEVSLRESRVGAGDGRRYHQGASGTNPDATIGAVTVGQNWISTQLAVGVTNFGADDAIGGAGTNADNLN